MSRNKDSEQIAAILGAAFALITLIVIVMANNAWAGVR